MASIGAGRPPGAGRRRVLMVVVGALVAVSAVVALARLGQLEGVLRRVEHASPKLLALAAACEVLSFAGYVVLTRFVFQPVAPRVSWTASVQITLAGVVATRLVTAGGVGGIALTVWALRAAGLDARAASRRLGAFLVVLYSLFFAALLVAGLGLATGALGDGVPRALAAAGGGVGALVFVLALGSRLAGVPAFAAEVVGLALEVVRNRPATLVAAAAWWTFDIGVLQATFEMFGAPPPLAVLVLCYFLGQLAQVIPVPGGIGPVEGGMIGAFAASGVPFALAVVSVLAYQAISTWLPAAPGLWAYVRLRRTVDGWRTGTSGMRRGRGARRRGGCGAPRPVA